MNKLTLPKYIFRDIQSKRLFASVYNYTDPKNPKVFMTVSRDNQPLGKMVFEVIIAYYNIIALRQPQPQDRRELQISMRR